MYAICQIFIKVRKFKKFSIFLNLTFELCENIKKQNKTRLYWRACQSWLGQLIPSALKCLRGIPDDFAAFHLQNLLIVEPSWFSSHYPITNN